MCVCMTFKKNERNVTNKRTHLYFWTLQIIAVIYTIFFDNADQMWVVQILKVITFKRSNYKYCDKSFSWFRWRRTFGFEMALLLIEMTFD